MSAFSLTVRDSRTMLRRNLKHAIRYPSVTLLVIGLPVILLLMFVYVFGGTLGAGLAVSMDMTEGIIARFRTMGIARMSVLIGHVLSSTIQTGVGLAVVIGVAMLVGFRPNAGIAEWLAVVGVLTMIVFAITWLSVALGLAARSVESASNMPMPLMLLPFLGSGFVLTASLPIAIRWFADYQPFTPFTETLRGLLLGSPIGTSALVAICWSVGITVFGYVWAMKLYDRDPSRTSKLKHAS
jgi:ABC-2 type transport system permease protein